MFDRTLRLMKNLDGQELKFSIASDEDGYVDRECPSNQCEFVFKVKEDDWVELFKDEAVYCPMCRHEAKSDEWFTTEQLKAAREQAYNYVRQQLGQALKSDARSFNQSQPRNSFLSMQMKVKGFPSDPISQRIPALEELELKIQCENCKARYAVLGSAFFCPCCGHNEIEYVFDQAMSKISQSINNLESIRAALVIAGNKDSAENICRSLIESGLKDAVTTFESYSIHAFKRLAPSTKMRRGVFQRIDDGSKLWKQLLGEGYQDWLPGKDLQELRSLLQKRHVLVHKDGLVDQSYLERSSDPSYKLGQRIVIKSRDVINVVKFLSKLKVGIQRSSKDRPCL